jgi:hypothetical protein
VKDRRALFFALAAVVCFILIPLAQNQFREVAAGVGAVYIGLAIASFLDHRSRRNSG